MTASRLDAVREADVVVVGAGAAGLSVALGLGTRRVDVLAKGLLGEDRQQPWAQGGIAGAVSPSDSPALHAADTLAVAGDGSATRPRWLGSPPTAPTAWRSSCALGARFDRDAAGRLDLAREAAHSRARVLHARDATGAEVVRALGRGGCATAAASASSSAPWRSSSWSTAAAWPASSRATRTEPSCCTGPARSCWRPAASARSSPARRTRAEATGDGLALAWRAGAPLADVEFVQFHPTALDAGADPMPLLTEALRGARRAARRRARRASPRRRETPELLPRDVVARGIWAALAAGRRAFLDARAAVGDALPRASSRPSSKPARCTASTRAASRSRSRPAAHYHMGGVAVDLDGRTGVAGLWAAGEVACTGVHGANRLASNSLLEALVFGARVARSVADTLPHVHRPAADLVLPEVAPAEAAPGTRPRPARPHVGRRRPRAHGRRPALRALAPVVARARDPARRGRSPQPRDGRAPADDGRARPAREPRRSFPRRPPGHGRGMAAPDRADAVRGGRADHRRRPSRTPRPRLARRRPRERRRTAARPRLRGRGSPRARRGPRARGRRHHRRGLPGRSRRPRTARRPRRRAHRRPGRQPPRLPPARSRRAAGRAPGGRRRRVGGGGDRLRRGAGPRPSRRRADRAQPARPPERDRHGHPRRGRPARGPADARGRDPQDDARPARAREARRARSAAARLTATASTTPFS